MKQKRIHIAVFGLLTAGINPGAIAQNGPGGVIATGTATNLGLWLTAERGTFNTGTTLATNGQSITTWADQSGRSTNNATNAGTATTRPTFSSTGPNGLPVLNFNALSAQTLSSALNINPTVLPNISVIVVAAASTVVPTTFAKIWGHDDGAYDRAVGIDNRAPGFNFGYFAGSGTGTGVGGLANLSAGNYFISTAVYAGGTGGTFSGWHDNAGIVSSATVSNTTGAGVLSIGSINSTAEYWNGPIAEFIVIEKALNEAERVILNNYLAAKYGLALAADDVYTMDNAGSGNYDYEVAGIGASTSGPGIISTRGTGIVQMGSASGMTAGEYFIFGHDNLPLAMSGPNRPAGYTSRLRRSWRPSEAGDVGTTTISFDLNGVSGLPASASNIALVVDRNNNGLFSDETVASTGVIAASAFAGGVATFTGVNIADQQRFTLAFTNTIALPLNLLSFTASAAKSRNETRWQTSDVKGVSGIELERSEDGVGFALLNRFALNESGVYAANDKTPKSISYYRLRIVSLDGSAEYSAVQKVTRAESGTVHISPNPVFNMARISGLPGTEATIQLLDPNGKVLSTTKSSAEDYLLPMQAYPAGSYLISVEAEGLHSVEQVVKQ